MDGIGEKIIIASIGATVALYLKYWYDQYLADKRVNEFRKTIIRVIDKRLIPKYIDISQDYSKLYKQVLEHIPGTQLILEIEPYSLEENDLRDIFPLEDIIKIFNRNKKVSYNSILKIEDYLIVLKKFSPEILATEYSDKVQEAYKNNLRDYQIDLIHKQYKDKFNNYEAYSHRIREIYELITVDLKNGLTYE